jgi:hypothetical protein
MWVISKKEYYADLRTTLGLGLVSLRPQVDLLFSCLLAAVTQDMVFYFFFFFFGHGLGRSGLGIYIGLKVPPTIEYNRYLLWIY